MPSEIDNLTKNVAYKISFFSFAQSFDGIISFPAFLKDFSDNYTSAWNPEPVYGKMDPIVTFKNTTRKISLAFDIPNEDSDAAQLNLSKINYLIRGLYPVYDGGKYGTAIMSSPPMFRVRFSNLIKNPSFINEDGETLKSGLLCYIDGFNFKPSIEDGFLVEIGENIFPKLINVNLTLNIIHEHPLGFEVQDGEGNIGFRSSFDKFPNTNLAFKEEPNQQNGSGATSSSGSPRDSGQAAAKKAGDKKVLKNK